MTPPLILLDLGVGAKALKQPPVVVPRFTKCSVVSLRDVPMVARGETCPTSYRWPLYEQGPGPACACFRRSAVGNEPRTEYEGESTPKVELRPIVADLLGFRYLE